MKNLNNIHNHNTIELPKFMLLLEMIADKKLLKSELEQFINTIKMFFSYPSKPLQNTKNTIVSDLWDILTNLKTKTPLKKAKK